MSGHLSALLFYEDLHEDKYHSFFVPFKRIMDLDCLSSVILHLRHDFANIFAFNSRNKKWLFKSKHMYRSYKKTAFAKKFSTFSYYDYDS